MKVKVLYYATFRQMTGCKAEDIEFNEAPKVKDLIYLLFQKYGGDFRKALVNSEGEVKDFIKILVNGRNIDFLEGLDTLLDDGDRVYFFPPVAGGV
jgi:molybdopterin synthase sulfur carrier subunit